MLKVFSIFDSKANAFMQPFFCANVAVAKRMCARSVMNQESDFWYFKEDYSLFELGSWDPDLGKFDLLSAPENLGLLATMRPMEVVS